MESTPNGKQMTEWESHLIAVAVKNYQASTQEIYDIAIELWKNHDLNNAENEKKSLEQSLRSDISKSH